MECYKKKGLRLASENSKSRANPKEKEKKGEKKGKLELTQLKEIRFQSRSDSNPSFHRRKIPVGEKRRKATGCWRWKER